MPITTRLLAGSESKQKPLVKATTGQALNQGKAAFAAGQDMETCPYHPLGQKKLQTAWVIGFKVAMYAKGSK